MAAIFACANITGNQNGKWNTVQMLIKPIILQKIN